ncbi:MAG: hypothetical protein NE330_16195 [Lentisphaeraceae bacterium]|nr:hypothetical protein [Lentisphaeraceae bacterium]
MIRNFFILFCFLLASPSNAKNINWKVPTLGGMCFWTDVKINKGGRIQQNVLTGHYRLLDQNDYRLAWGNYDDCLESFVEISKLNLKPKVLLIHGLTIKKNSLEPLRNDLEKEGYDVHFFRFSCFYQPIESTAKSLKKVLEHLGRDVRCVTHSTGAILLRQYEKDFQSYGISKVVMLTAPNQGVVLVDWLKAIKLDCILGVNGKRLHSGKGSLPTSLPDVSVDHITISGKNGHKKYYFPLLWFSQSHDGLLRTATGESVSALENIEVEGHHFLIMNHRQVKDKICQFFKE